MRDEQPLQLNKRDQEYLDKILDKKSLLELSIADVEFLRARSSYLTEAQLEYYAEVLITPEEKLVNKEDKLTKMTREQLDQILDNLGLDPKDFANKRECIEAITSFGKAPEGEEDDSEGNSEEGSEDTTEETTEENK